MPSSPFQKSTARRHIVQCARSIGLGYGVSGPAYQLERAFTELGCTCERFTLENLGLRSRKQVASTGLAASLSFWRDIVWFSLAGSVALRWKFRARRRDPHTVVICHVDALYGDLFVVRSLHRGFVARHPARIRILFRNPLHAFLLVRDAIRFRWNVHPHIVTLSEGNKDELVRFYGVRREKITVIPNGVDLERFQPSRCLRRDARRQLSIPPDGFVIVFVGQEFERKGLSVLFDALRLLSGRGWNMTLIVVGGDRQPNLINGYAELQGAVRFVGYREDVERYYAAADIFAMPAWYDISPLAGLEALASGLPILMTDLGGVREYLRDGENGWFITRDPWDVAGKIERLAKDPLLRQNMSVAARASVSNRGWRAVAQQFLDLLDQVFPMPETYGTSKKL
jgi:UDP-glucose:(heptosyl)LPS alpha-1,3-glucosyltransferase